MLVHGIIEWLAKIKALTCSVQDCFCPHKYHSSSTSSFVLLDAGEYRIGSYSLDHLVLSPAHIANQEINAYMHAYIHIYIIIINIII